MRRNARTRLPNAGFARPLHASASYGGADLSREPVCPAPHPELGEQTTRLHLWLVESATYFHGADVDAISDGVCLPEWNVRRALHALGLAGEPDRARGGDRQSRRVAAWLRENGPATVSEAAAGCGLSWAFVAAMMRRAPDVFRQCGRAKATYGPAPALWEVA